MTQNRPIAAQIGGLNRGNRGESAPADSEVGKKIMKCIAALLMSLLVLSACVNEPGVVHDQHTGMTVVHSKRFPVSSGLLHNTHATAGYSNKNGYSVVIEHMATGGSWNHFTQAWSYGKQFNYVPGQGRVMGCSGGCTLLEGGAVRMSEADFRNYAKTGFTFKLVGTGGSIELSVPAEAFRQVLAQVR